MEEYGFWGLTDHSFDAYRMSFEIRISDLKNLYPDFDFTGYVILSGGFTVVGESSDDEGVNYLSTDHSGPLPDNGYSCSVTAASKKPFRFNVGLLYKKPKSKPPIPPAPPLLTGLGMFSIYS